jgi:hypothetical protein
MSQAAAAIAPQTESPAPSKPDPQEAFRKKTEDKEPAKAHESRLSLSPDGHRYADVQYTMGVDEKYEDALKPSFWSQVAHRFKWPADQKMTFAGAIIGLWWQDHSYHARLYVRAVQKHGLIVAPMGKPVKLAPDPKENDLFEKRWNVGKLGYDIIRKADREIVGDGTKFPTVEEADAWIEKAMRLA